MYSTSIESETSIIDYEYIAIFVLVISGYLSYILTIIVCAYWLRPFLEMQHTVGQNPQHERRLREALVGEESSISGMNSIEDLTPFGGRQGDENEQSSNEDIEIRENYSFLKLVGEGRSGKVYMARKIDNNEFVAVKVIPKETAADYIILREWMILRLVVSCPFVVQCHLRYETLESHCFVMEYLSGGSLANFVKKHGTFPEEYVKNLLAEIVCGVEALHDCGILIRDLNVDNIMFDSDNHIKLIDFGESEVGMFGSRKIRRRRAHVLRLCPEMLLGLPYDHGADLWALGILMWELLLGKNPFERADEPSAMEAILYDALPEDQLQSVSKDASSLLQKLLEKEPSARIKLSGVKQHSFFQTVDWEKIRLKVDPLPSLNSSNCS